MYLVYLTWLSRGLELLSESIASGGRSGVGSTVGSFRCPPGPQLAGCDTPPLKSALGGPKPRRSRDALKGSGMLKGLDPMVASVSFWYCAARAWTAGSWARRCLRLRPHLRARMRALMLLVRRMARRWGLRVDGACVEECGAVAACRAVTAWAARAAMRAMSDGRRVAEDVGGARWSGRRARGGWLWCRYVW